MANPDLPNFPVGSRIVMAMIAIFVIVALLRLLGFI
jgi:hypothetical protein